MNRYYSLINQVLWWLQTNSWWSVLWLFDFSAPTTVANLGAGAKGATSEAIKDYLSQAQSMVGKSKSGFNNFCQTQWIWIWIWTSLDLPAIGINDLNGRRTAHVGCYHGPGSAQSCSDRCYTQWSTALTYYQRTRSSGPEALQSNMNDSNYESPVTIC